MKKLAIILFTTLFYFSQSGQTYNKMLLADTTTWQHFGTIYGVKSNSPQNISLFYPNSYAAIDTITIAGFAYKKFYELSTPAFLNYGSKQLLGYLREDTLARKIYFKETIAGTESLLYDFSLNVNDSMLINFPFNTWDNGYYYVDSIITKTEICGPRKHFYLRRHMNNSNPAIYYYDFIESIGSSYHIIYKYNNGMSYAPFPYPLNCIYQWGEGLACKKNKSIQQYQSCTNAAAWNNNNSSCVYYRFLGGIHENTNAHNLSIYPNPASSKLKININVEKDQSLSISIIDVFGKALQSHKNIAINAGENSYEVNTSKLENGIYSILLESNNLKRSKTFLIQN